MECNNSLTEEEDKRDNSEFLNKIFRDIRDKLENFGILFSATSQEQANQLNNMIATNLNNLKDKFNKSDIVPLGEYEGFENSKAIFYDTVPQNGTLYSDKEDTYQNIPTSSYLMTLHSENRNIKHTEAEILDKLRVIINTMESPESKELMDIVKDKYKTLSSSMDVNKQLSEELYKMEKRFSESVKTNGDLIRELNNLEMNLHLFRDKEFLNNIHDTERCLYAVSEWKDRKAMLEDKIKSVQEEIQIYKNGNDSRKDISEKLKSYETEINKVENEFQENKQQLINQIAALDSAHNESLETLKREMLSARSQSLRAENEKTQYMLRKMKILCDNTISQHQKNMSIFLNSFKESLTNNSLSDDELITMIDKESEIYPKYCDYLLNSELKQLKNIIERHCNDSLIDTKYQVNKLYQTFERRRYDLVSEKEKVSSKIVEINTKNVELSRGIQICNGLLDYVKTLFDNQCTKNERPSPDYNEKHQDKIHAKTDTRDKITRSIEYESRSKIISDTLGKYFDVKMKIGNMHFKPECISPRSGLSLHSQREVSGADLVQHEVNKFVDENMAPNTSQWLFANYDQDENYLIVLRDDEDTKKRRESLAMVEQLFIDPLSVPNVIPRNVEETTDKEFTSHIVEMEKIQEERKRRESGNQSLAHSDFNPPKETDDNTICLNYSYMYNRNSIKNQIFKAVLLDKPTKPIKTSKKGLRKRKSANCILVRRNKLDANMNPLSIDLCDNDYDIESNSLLVNSRNGDITQKVSRSQKLIDGSIFEIDDCVEDIDKIRNYEPERKEPQIVMNNSIRPKINRYQRTSSPVKEEDLINKINTVECGTDSVNIEDCNDSTPCMPQGEFYHHSKDNIVEEEGTQKHSPNEMKEVENDRAYDTDIKFEEYLDNGNDKVTFAQFIESRSVIREPKNSGMKKSPRNTSKKSERNYKESHNHIPRKHKHVPDHSPRFLKRDKKQGDKDGNFKDALKQTKYLLTVKPLLGMETPKNEVYNVGGGKYNLKLDIQTLSDSKRSTESNEYRFAIKLDGVDRVSKERVLKELQKKYDDNLTMEKRRMKTDRKKRTPSTTGKYTNKNKTIAYVKVERVIREIKDEY